ncbi:hypothetical protein K431DRAFT_322260 [Polychaeton citri CBS 116435]|uniref:Ubiquitin-conjugating enzyme E2 1 n=1 Tax=Polychaeton citri CBS 116435 TaxID=1314669 RepID=A0A9P4Q363_9PEZI|nr:hypothetical protein K431DRAFT_322260 [Polychaeton citri CBS 116435]
MATKNRRLQKEIQSVLEDKHCGITLASPSGGDASELTDLTHFHGHFKGPPDTPYEGGKYHVDIRIPSDYPFKPPEMRFITKIWHPNVSSQTGAICLDTLKEAWSPILTLKSALISLQSLLSSPEPKDPQDAEVAVMLLKRPDEFAHVARQWAIRYAEAPKSAPGSGKTGASGSGGVDEAALKAKSKEEAKLRKKREEEERQQAYRGYSRTMIDQFVNMGFQVEQVVSAFEYVGIDRNDGQEYELEEEYIGDVTARLFNEM